MAKKQNIEIHNEEVREIMKEIPGRLLRWGLTIIFLNFASVIVSIFFLFPLSMGKMKYSLIKQISRITLF